MTPVDENRQMPEEAVDQAPEMAGGETGVEAEAPQVSRSQAWRQGYRQRPGRENVNVDNDDEYYDAVEQDYADLDRYKQMDERFSDNINKSPVFADMVAASKDQEDFDPFLYAIEQSDGEEDFDAAIQDSNYLKKVAEGNAKAVARKAQEAKQKEEFQANITPCIEAIKAKAQEMGLDADQEREVWSKYYNTALDATSGKFYPEIFELIAKGMNYDQAVNDAREQGVQQGMETKVTDRLRDISAQRETGGGGRQPAVEEAAPAAPKARNPFMD